MDVTLLYFDGCPNWRHAEDVVRQALRTVELPEQVLTVRCVETQEQAALLSFPGSPTVLINDEDPFVDQAAALSGLMCRLYRTPTGFAGSPTREEVTAALQSRM